MAIITNTFNRYAKNNISSGGELLIDTTGVPTNTDMTVMGFVITNVTAAPITITAYVRIDGNPHHLVKNNIIPEGESLIVIGWDQKLVLKTTDDIYVETSGPTEFADAILSVLEIAKV